MKRIRVRMIMLAGWLALFFSMERLLEPINISRVAYSFVLALVFTTLVASRFARAPLWLILAVPIPIFIVLKAWTGGFAGGLAVPLTVTEISAIAVTTFLAHWVSQAISEFESAVAHITIGRRDKVPEPASLGQGSIYREVRRARNHQRPLTLMAVAVEEKSIKVALDRMVQEAQLAMIKQYILSGVSKTLCDKLEDCDIVVQSDGNYLVALPETTPDDMPGLIDRLRQQVFDQVGVELRIGTASLPQDSFTFEGLLDKATKEMEEGMGSQPFLELEQISLEHHRT
jgi:hypothetical protein